MKRIINPEVEIKVKLLRIKCKGQQQFRADSGELRDQIPDNYPPITQSFSVTLKQHNYE